MSNIQSLEGLTIKDVQISTDRKALKLVTDKGDVIAKVDGDCCSDSWIENVDMPARGLPALVYGSAELDLEKPEEKLEYGDVLAFYGYEIVTDKGHMTIDYRNESNGYYGGDISWPWDSYFYGGVYGQNNSKMEWVSLDQCPPRED